MDMYRVVVAQINPRKCRQSIRHIVSMIFDGPIKDRKSVLRQVTELLAEFFYSGGHQSKKEEIRQLAYAIAERGLAENDISFFSCVESQSDYFSDDPYCQACNRLGVAYFRYFGRDLDTTMKFCRVFFQEHAKYFEVASAREVPEPIYLNNYKDGGMFYLATQAATLPPIEQYPQKYWFNNLVRATAQGDKQAASYLKGAMSLVFFNTPEHYTIWSHSELVEWVGDDPERQKQYWSKRADPQNPIIIIEDGMKGAFLEYWDRLTQEGYKLLDDCHRLEEWFKDNQAAISEVFDRRCQEILQKPKHLLRPFGYDSIMIRVSILNAVGIKSVSFHPEGERFPDCKLSVSKKGAGEIYLQVWAMFREFSLIARNQLLTGVSPIASKEFRNAIFEFIIVDALHRIIVGRPKKNLDNEKVERGKYQTSSEPRREVVVRPFIRRLPEGFSASDEARDYAFTHLGIDLPEGFTFVRSHERWIGLPEGKPAPLFSYSDDTIMRSIEQ